MPGWGENLADLTHLHKKTIDDIDVGGRRVLVRADLNVPMKQGVITDDFKIRASLATINKLRERDARVIVATHIGRPKGRHLADLSALPLIEKFKSLGGFKPEFASDIFADGLKDQIDSLPQGGVLLLENTRFWPGETTNDDVMAKRLASLCDIFVLDGFGSAHRAHASTSGVAQKVTQAVAGELLAAEYNEIADITFEPARPFTAVIGGAKIGDKIKLLEQFIETADNIIVGGAMANDFLVAMGHDVEDSLVEKDSIDEAKRIMQLADEQAKKRRFTLALPSDVVVGHSIEEETSPSIVDLTSFHYVDVVFYPKKPPTNTVNLQDAEMIGDIGPYSTAFARGIIASSATVVWNGLTGVVETAPAAGEALGPFEFSSHYIAQEIMNQTKRGLKSLVGGGDTAGYIITKDMQDGFTHVSTGGGASIDLVVDQHLIAIEALDDADPETDDDRGQDDNVEEKTDHPQHTEVEQDEILEPVGEFED